MWQGISHHGRPRVLAQASALPAKFRPQRIEMWKFFDLDSTKNYRLLLVQGNAGSRHFELHEEFELPVREGLFSCTKRIPIELLLRRNLQEISKKIELADGSQFHVDAHNIWLTNDEMKAILEDKDENEIPWLNSLPPQLGARQATCRLIHAADG
jgi:hypothetical protein